jgi:hypothetical protein
VNPEKTSDDEDGLADLLAAYDEALAAGRPPPGGTTAVPRA